MSAFNEANELASQLVWSRHYCSDEPCEKLNEVVLCRDGERKVIPAPSDPTHEVWGDTATFLENLFKEGWTVWHDPATCRRCDSEPTPSNFEGVEEF
jgi:hypothetical protein